MDLGYVTPVVAIPVEPDVVVREEKNVVRRADADDVEQVDVGRAHVMVVGIDGGHQHQRAVVVDEVEVAHVPSGIGVLHREGEIVDYHDLPLGYLVEQLIGGHAEGVLVGLYPIQKPDLEHIHYVLGGKPIFVDGTDNVPWHLDRKAQVGDHGCGLDVLEEISTAATTSDGQQRDSHNSRSDSDRS